MEKKVGHIFFLTEDGSMMPDKYLTDYMFNMVGLDTKKSSLTDGPLLNDPGQLAALMMKEEHPYLFIMYERNGERSISAFKENNARAGIKLYFLPESMKKNPRTSWQIIMQEVVEKQIPNR